MKSSLWQTSIGCAPERVRTCIAIGVLSAPRSPIMSYGFRFTEPRGGHRGLCRFRQSLFAASAAAGTVARISCQRRRNQRVDDRRHRGDRALGAVHWRARRRRRPQTPDHWRHVRGRGADADHHLRRQRAPTYLLALRPGPVAPPIFAITVAYIGDEWPPAEV